MRIRSNESGFDIETGKRVDDGLGLEIKHKVLYHGSNTPGISNFREAEETTVGNGLYLTSRPEDARGYATRRAKNRRGQPVLYSVEVNDLRLADLRKDENVAGVLEGFKDKLKGVLQRSDLKWHYENSLKDAVAKINGDEVKAGNLRDVAFAHGGLFSEYLGELGYDGLITFEGGEGVEVGRHDTYLVFDPQKAKLFGEETV